MHKVAVSSAYLRTAGGCQALRFAADLHKRLGCAQFRVIIPSPHNALADAEQLQAVQERLIRQDVSRITSLPEADVAVTVGVEDGIVVAHTPPAQCGSVDFLYPGREEGILSRGKGPVLLPFGDSNSALPAAIWALTIAKALALPVVLYHTTWKDPRIASTAPDEHMCKAAKSLFSRLTSMCEAGGVAYESVIETADDVVEGVLRCAMRHSARLIVMSRSDKTTVGCYVDQALTQSPVPVLAVASSQRRPA
jgi:hypothetical protein